MRLKVHAGRFLVAVPLLVVLTLGCQPAPKTQAPDIGATVAAAIQTALPPTPTPNIPLTVEAQVQERLAAIPTPTPTSVPPTPTPTLTPTPTPTRVPPTPTPTTKSIVDNVRPAIVRIEAGQSTGSGFITQVGFPTAQQHTTALVLTNYHVIEGATSVEVVVNDHSRFDAVVWGVDPGNDIALLRICCGNFEALEWADQSEISEGDQAIAIGYPLGIPGKASITNGIISAERYEFGQWVIQTDAAINPGNSGGPLISSNGKVLGMNTRKEFYSSDGRPVDGLGFAVSLKTIQSVLESLKSGYMKPTPPPALTPVPPPTATFDASSYYNKGEEYRKAENWAMAIVEYTTAIQVNPNYASAYFGRAWSYDELGQDQNAVNDLTMVIQLEPDYVEAYNNRGISYNNLGHYQLAINDYTKAIQLDPSASRYTNRGSSYYDLGHYQLAINDYTKAIQLDPDYAHAYANRGNSYDELGQYQQAILELNTAIQLDPDFAWAHFIRAFVYRHLGQTANANADDAMACSLDSYYC